MKIQKVIHACDDKEFYYDFWPIVSKIWKLKFNIEPVLLYFGTKNPSTEYGTVVHMEILPDIPVNTQCQLSRYWIPVTEPDTIWMTSDIDMLPISRQYFIDNINHISNDKFVALNSDPREKYPNLLYSCCYNVAQGKTFTDLLGILPSWKDFMSTGFWKENTHNYKPDGLSDALPHWGADEMWSSKKINQYHDQNRIIRLHRDCGRHRCNRIDRLEWNWSDDKVKNEYYYDCHSIRPYKTHKESIDRLVNLIINK
jgi:hypothetical protein